MAIDDCLRRLDDALAFDERGLPRRPLDLIGWLRPVAMMSASEKRDRLLRRVYVESPLPFWRLARWAQVMDGQALGADAATADSPGWSFGAGSQLGRPELLREISDRFDEFEPAFYPWGVGPDCGTTDQERKFVLGREMARSYVASAAGEPRGGARVDVLEEHRDAWSEWFAPAGGAGFSESDAAMATAIAHDHLVTRRFTTGVDGVGKAHVLLEELNIDNSPASAVVMAGILPLPAEYARFDGMLVPDMRGLGVLKLSDGFIESVSAAWRYCRMLYPTTEPTLLSFAVCPSRATVLQKLSGRSAETAVLAAIDSACRGRALRPNAAASATVELPENTESQDPLVGPASFETKKYNAALVESIATVVVHTDVAREWKRTDVSKRGPAGGPDLVATEFFRRDALPLLETRSLWKLSYYVPLAICAAFACLALIWQMYKASASGLGEQVTVYEHRLPLASPLLLASEMVCLFLCALVLLYCVASIRKSLDSLQSAVICLATCAAVIAVAQFVPIGLRSEGLLDNPFYSVLFGEPQLKARHVIDAGAFGMLVLHALSQSFGFITIALGTSAIVIRLYQTRAFSEPIYDDRIALIKSDLRFAVTMATAGFSVILMFGFARNVSWYYFLTTLSGLPMIDRQGSILAVVGPLLGICVVLAFCVGFVWLIIVYIYLRRVVETSHGRSGYSASDVITGLPTGARLLCALSASS